MPREAEEDLRAVQQLRPPLTPVALGVPTAERHDWSTVAAQRTDEAAAARNVQRPEEEHVDVALQPKVAAVVRKERQRHEGCVDSPLTKELVCAAGGDEPER